MRLSDLPMPVLFIIFLSLFILLGIYPAWKKTAAKIRNLLQSANKPEEPLADRFTGAEPDNRMKRQTDLQLNDFETIILRRLAQNGDKALSRKQINADLHLERAIVNQTMESLLYKDLVGISFTSFLGVRFFLTEQGHAYATEQGYMIGLHRLNGSG